MLVSDLMTLGQIIIQELYRIMGDPCWECQIFDGKSTPMEPVSIWGWFTNSNCWIYY